MLSDDTTAPGDSADAVGDPRVDPSLEAFNEPLTEEEKRSIALRLGPLLAGAGLLALGAAYGALRPDQMPVAALIQGLAAVTVSVSVGIRGVRGFLARPTRDLTAQLVTLAVLAAMSVGDFITATLVPLLMELGQLFEERSSRGARAAIEGIRKLRAQRARRLDSDGSSEEEVNPDEVRKGEVVIVRPGEVIPVDGKVVSGHSSVDQSPITGESVYAEVEPGSDVFSGTVNLGGLLRIEAAGGGGESVIGRVLSLLRQVEQSKTAAIRLVERLARVYLPIIVAIAAVTLFLTGETRRAIAVLVVACPSALFLAGPVAMVAATTACTRLRILIKSATFLETVADVRTLIFDKTGTVTMGSMTVHGIHTIDGATEDEVLRAAAACAQGSLHPVSRAVALESEKRGLEIEHAGKVLEEPGNGVVAETDAGLCRLGRARWLESLGLEWEHGTAAKNSTGAWVARGDRVLGYVALADRPREEAFEALRQTSRMGIDRMILITGDREEVAASVAEELGFDEYVAEVLPERKLELVRQEQEAGRKVMMVGDGVNDALALSGADVGVAVGARVNEIALGGADVALMTSDLNRLWRLMGIARFTRTLVVQNILLVAGFSAIMIALASRGIISPLTGAWLHNIDAFFVILNSSRILRFAESFGKAQVESAGAPPASPASIFAGTPNAAPPPGLLPS
ncbi:MAG: cation-translocating P-type ATPase [Acidobacteriota bacterium]